MVVLPNLFLYVARFLTINNSMLGWFYCLFALRSAFNIWVIGFALKDFKITFIRMFFSWCLSNHSQIASIEDTRPDGLPTVTSKMDDQTVPKNNMARISF
uniref:Uncharacterized protein n=1 Tax=Panagrolaimus sp. JU765 TaxID=591449 RepID=A0AC34QXT9_9BILA